MGRYKNLSKFLNIKIFSFRLEQLPVKELNKITEDIHQLRHLRDLFRFTIKIQFLLKLIPTF